MMISDGLELKVKDEKFLTGMQNTVSNKDVGVAVIFVLNVLKLLWVQIYSSIALF